MSLHSNVRRILQMGFQAPHARLPSPAAGAAQPEHRTLPHRTVMTLHNAALQLRVLRGCVWITRDGCPADLVLVAGDVYEQRPGPRVLVQALQAAELVVAAPASNTQNA